MKKRNFFHSAGLTVTVMMAATLFAKALGLVRQMMTVGIFAASMEGIAFSAASKIPLAIFDMLFSTAILGAFLPIYKGRLQENNEKAKCFSSSFLSAVAIVTSLIAVLGVIFAEFIIGISAPELDRETAALAATLLRIMFPSMIFAGMAYTLIGILQSHEKFILPALVSAVSNLIMIGYLAFCSVPADKNAAIGLAFAYLISWAAQFMTLAVPLIREKAFPIMTFHIFHADTALALRRALPVMFGSWLIPMITLIANAFSSFVDSGAFTADGVKGAAIVVYENAFSVFSIAAGLLTYGVCNYIFPKLSASAAKKDGEGFSRLIGIGLTVSLALILPIAVAVFLLSEEIISFLYLRGNVTPALAHAAAISLRALILAMPAYGLTELFSRVCYSAGKVRFPMISSLTGIAVTALMGAIFLRAGALSVATVALAASLGQIAAALILFILCFLYFPGVRTVLSLPKLAAIAAGTLLSGCAMTVFKRILKQFLNFSHTFENFMTITIVFTVGIVVYLLWLVMIKPVFADMLRQTMRKGGNSVYEQK